MFPFQPSWAIREGDISSCVEADFVASGSLPHPPHLVSLCSLGYASLSAGITGSHAGLALE